MSASDLDYALALSIQDQLLREQKDESSSKKHATSDLHKRPNMAASDLDYSLALSLQDQFFNEQRDESSRKKQDESGTQLHERYDPKLIVDERWELLDPHPNIHDLFVQFDAMFFERRLVNAGVEVRWSPRMTLCAGVCSYEGRGGLCSVRVSVPLLKLRPRKDLVETLLHEMIHALLFVTERNTDHDGHGPNFCAHMNRINSLTGSNISVYHTFHQEVKLYRQHWWRCNGPCRNRPPFYGWVKRAMNRAPSPRDRWWNEHQSSCGGSYSKVKEPEGYGKKTKMSAEGKNYGVLVKKPSISGCKDIKDMLKGKREKSGEQSKRKIPPLTSNSVGDGNSSTGDVLNGEELKLKSQASSSSRAGSANQSISLNERRQKILEAVEKRQQMRGIKRKSDSSSRLSSNSKDIRGFWSTSPSHKEKKPKSETITSSPKSDSSLNNRDTIISSPIASSNPPPYEPYSELQLKEPQSIKFSNGFKGSTSVKYDVHISRVDPPLISEISSDNGDGRDRDVIVIDDDDDDVRDGNHGGDNVSLGMCPVCGCLDIPKDIINIHVSNCLDEEEEEEEAMEH